jgi:hypothetical protein
MNMFVERELSVSRKECKEAKGANKDLFFANFASLRSLREIFLLYVL